MLEDERFELLICGQRAALVWLQGDGGLGAAAGQRGSANGGPGTDQGEGLAPPPTSLRSATSPTTAGGGDKGRTTERHPPVVLRTVAKEFALSSWRGDLGSR